MKRTTKEERVRWGQSPVTRSTLAHRTVLGPQAVRLNQCSSGATLTLTREQSRNQVVVELAGDQREKSLLAANAFDRRLSGPVLSNSTEAVLPEVES